MIDTVIKNVVSNWQCEIGGIAYIGVYVKRMMPSRAFNTSSLNQSCTVASR